MTAAENLSDLTGKRIPGGCDDCTAYQVLSETEPNVIVLEVRHDATCPTYRRMVRERGKS